MILFDGILAMSIGKPFKVGPLFQCCATTHGKAHVDFTYKQDCGGAPITYTVFLPFTDCVVFMLHLFIF